RCSEFIYPGNIARCQHIKVNGIQCGSPALKRRKFCYFHHQWHQRGVTPNATSCFSLDLPLLEDANSIQVALMRVMYLLLTNQIDQKKAALLLYALQTASGNLRRTKFEPQPQEVVIDRSGVPDTSLGDDAWYKEEFTEDEEAQEEETKTSAPAALGKPPAAGVLPPGAPAPSEGFRLAPSSAPSTATQSPPGLTARGGSL
ncbi:MAG: hypothetical protein WCC22_13445, partial [Terriglobales bacterium]